MILRQMLRMRAGAVVLGALAVQASCAQGTEPAARRERPAAPSGRDRRFRIARASPAVRRGRSGAGVVAHGASARRRRGRRHSRGRPVRSARRKGAHLEGPGRRGTPPVGVASPGAPRGRLSLPGEGARSTRASPSTVCCVPVVSLPADVADVSLASHAALVRAESGERWMIEPASGKRLPVSPAGLLQVAALDDGRAAALVEGGQLLVSTDAGEHWTDASGRLRAPAKRVFVARTQTTHEDSLWVETQGAGRARAARRGQTRRLRRVALSRPSAVAAREAAGVARRRAATAPRRAVGGTVARRYGARRRERRPRAGRRGLGGRAGRGRGQAAAGRDVRRRPGRRTTSCSRALARTARRSSSRTRSTVRRWSSRPSPTGAASSSATTAASSGREPATGLSRAPAAWRACGLPEAAGSSTTSTGTGDAGTSGTTFNVVRWIPRADGGAIAVVGDIGGVANAWGLVDGRTGELHAWPTDALTPVMRSALQANDGTRLRPAGCRDGSPTARGP